MLIALQDNAGKIVARYEMENPTKYIRLGDRVFRRGFIIRWIWNQVFTTEVKLKDRVKFDAKPNKRQPKQLSLLDQ